MSRKERRGPRAFYRRFTAVRRRLRAFDAAREPAARLLPPEEHWRPRTWAHFRFIVLGHLQIEGAHSLRDLAGDSPEVLGLQLSRRELRAILESCRRRGFVARLDPTSGFGAPTHDDEWVVTPDGRRATRPAVPWLLGHAGRATRPIASVVAALVGLLGIGLTAGGGIGDFEDALPFALGLAALFWLVILLRHRLSGGRGGRVVAEDWARWRRDCPDLCATAFERFPWGWFLLAAAALATGVVVVLWVPGVEDESRGMAIVLLLAWAIAAPVRVWAKRWNQIEASAVNHRTRARVDRAVREVVESEARVGAAAPVPPQGID